MKKSSILILVFTLAFIVSCKKDTKESTNENSSNTETVTSNDDTKNETSKTAKKDDIKKIAVPLQSKNNSNVTGNVIFREEKGIVSMIAIVSGLSEGEHSIHIGSEAECTSGNKKPANELKDGIGSITANDKGQGTINFTTKEWCIGCDDSTKDILGKAIIIYQGTDSSTEASKGNVNCCGIIQ